MAIFQYLFVDTVIFIIVAVYLLHKYLSRHFEYWEKRKIFFIPPEPFFGNIRKIAFFKTTLAEHLRTLYNSTREPFFGMFVFGTPHLVVRDPKIIKAIMITDFHLFPDRIILSSKHDPLSAHMLFFSKSPDWKILRSRMTPIFTSGKLKAMLSSINDIGDKMKTYISKNLSSEAIEAKEISALFATDVIAKCAFAINANSFENTNGDFRTAGKQIFEFNWKNVIQQTSFFLLPDLASILRMKFIDERASNFLTDVFWKSIAKREESDKQGKDVIDMIVEMRKDKELCNKIDFHGDKVLAQAAIFFVAGFETTSTTMGFTLYELCIHRNIQQKVRADIKNSIQRHGGLTYEAIQDMQYLHMVICEALRKYPALAFLDRKCGEDYTIPGTSVVLEKGTPILIPMLGLHYDPEYFPNPDKFIPERFDETSDKRNSQSFVYMPFGDGPRKCIGERFGLLVTKMGLIKILLEFEVERTEQTPVPLKFESKSLVLASDVGLPMRFKRCTSSVA